MTKPKATPTQKPVTALPTQKTNKYRVNTRAHTKNELVPIGGMKCKLPTAPRVLFTPEAWDQQCFIVKECALEVGWFTLVTHYPESNVFVVDKIILPEQEVSPVETDISGEHWAAATFELIQEGEDPTRMYGWFHSHVDMGVTPSGQDERQVEEFLEDLVDVPEVPAFIRGIQNKKGDLKIDVYYMHEGYAFTNVEHGIYDPNRIDNTAGLSDLIKKRVKKQRYTYNGTAGNARWIRKSTAPASAGPSLRNAIDDQAEFELFNTNHHIGLDVDGNYIPGARYATDLFWDAVQGFYCNRAGEICVGYNDTWDETTPLNERPNHWHNDAEYLDSGIDNDLYNADNYFIDDEEQFEVSFNH